MHWKVPVISSLPRSRLDRSLLHPHWVGGHPDLQVAGAGQAGLLVADFPQRTPYRRRLKVLVQRLLAMHRGAGRSDWPVTADG